MMEIVKEKKQWSTPEINVLNFKETKGGTPIDFGEDSYADQNPTSGLN